MKILDKPYLSAMKGVIKSTELGIQDCYENLVMPILRSVAQSDSRRKNTVYSALDALKSSFAIFHLKSPSLFAFQPKTKAEKENLKSVYQIESVPTDNDLRNIIDTLDCNLINDGFSSIVPYLEAQGIIDNYKYYNGYYIYSLDGVQHQCSKKVKCEKCLESVGNSINRLQAANFLLYFVEKPR